MENLRQELHNLTVGDLMYFLWKFWFANLFAVLLPAIILIVAAHLLKEI
jgi:hypothetical protein